MTYLPIRTIAPAALFTWAELDAHLRLDGATEEQALVEALAAAATSHLDGYSGILGRALVSQTWRQDFVGFCDRMSLPLAPVASVTSVTYRDAEDASQTLATSVYELRADALGPYVALIPGQSWPSTSTVRNAPVSVTYVAGYGAASEVPQAIRQAALLLIGHWYESREAVAIGVTPTTVPKAVDALITPFRRVGI